MPESKSKLLFPAISTAIVVAGGIAAYVYFKSTTGNSNPINSAKVVPANALMAIYINTDPQSWNQLKQFGTIQARDMFTKGLQDLQKELSTDTNISYEGDIKPWINGVMIAELPPTVSTPVQEQSNTLIVVGIKDKLSALKFANKLRQQKSIQIEESDYKGQKIIVAKNQSQSSYISILNNTYILLASEKKIVEKAIDTYKGEPSFANKEGASSILTKNVDVKNSLGQIYVPDYANVVQNLIAPSLDSQPLTPQTLKQLKQLKSLVAGVGVDDAGVRLKAIINLDPQLNNFENENTPTNIVTQFPSDTFALINGKNINQIWQNFVKESQNYPELNQAVAQTRNEIKQQANLDLDKDIFSWMNGEFAFGAVKSNQGQLASIGFGGAIVFDTSDRKTAETTFTKLDNFAKKQLLNVVQRDISRKKITEWQIPEQGAFLSHGWLDQDTVFIALGEPIGEKLADNKGQTLNNSDTFKTIIGSLAKPNSGYFYLDMDNTISIISQLSAVQFGEPIPSDVSAILGSIRGVGITSNSPNKSTIQMEMLLALKPNK